MKRVVLLIVLVALVGCKHKAKQPDKVWVVY